MVVRALHRRIRPASAQCRSTQRRTSTANDYGYKQLLYEPFLGSGPLAARSLPLIAEFGLLAFTITSLALTSVFGVWGMRRKR
jgi:glutamate:Na+ symporter, ESS family